MFKGLSLDQAPPFEGPLAFFTVGVLFGFIAVVSLFFHTSPIATLHLFTLGFFASIMMGALQQMLPVVVGVYFKKPLQFALITLLPFMMGVLFFSLSFNGYNLFLFALVALAFSLGLFSSTTLLKLLQSPRITPTVRAMQLSLLSFIIVIVFGITMLAKLTSNNGFDAVLPQIHALFALFGWIGLLIIGVSFQVIPMFYVTDELNEKIRYFLVYATAFLLLLTTIVVLFLPKLFIPMLFITTLPYAFYALLMIKNIKNRKRAIQEPSIAYWYIGFVSLLLLPLITLFDSEKGVIFYLFGFASSIIFAMLYKIIPFLSWFHISSRGFFDMPTMKEMVDERAAFVQLFLHINFLLFLFIDLHGAAILFATQLLIMSFNLYKSIKIYFSYRSKPSPFANVH